VTKINNARQPHAPSDASCNHQHAHQAPQEQQERDDAIMDYNQNYNMEPLDDLLSSTEITWSKEQALAIHAVKMGKNVWITGPGGTGKTFLVSYLIRYLNQINKNIQVTASTGIAAVAIGGITLHGFISCGTGEESITVLKNKIQEKPEVMSHFKQLDVLIIDEISMILPEFFEKASQILCHVRGVHSVPFGGLQVILLGDFLQLPPVKKKNNNKPPINTTTTTTTTNTSNTNIKKIVDPKKQIESC
jgi:DNA replication protein DnaC